MGLGGYLMWTGIAKNIVKHAKKYNLDIVVRPVENMQGGYKKVIRSCIFENNDDFYTDNSVCTNVLDLVLNDPKTNYCLKDTAKHALHRYDKHVIQQVCESYGIENADIKCILNLNDDELAQSLCLHNEFDNDYPNIKKFITIEPDTKDEYTLNKAYPFEKFQNVVNKLSQQYDIVQLGMQKSRLLENVIDMRGRTTFREAAGLIKRSALFIGTEGGLMHAANAVNTKSVIIFTGFMHPRMTGYPENINIWVGANGHGPCGMKIRCSQCEQECLRHNEHEITNAALSILSL